MSESRLWDWLRDRLPSGHASRVESEITPGFPDVTFTLRHGQIRGISVSFELKFGKPTAKLPLKRKIRQAQIDWHHDEYLAGGLSWWVIEVKDRVFFIPGEEGHQLAESPVLMLEHLSDLIVKRRRDKPSMTTEFIRDLILSRRI